MNNCTYIVDRYDEAWISPAINRPTYGFLTGNSSLALLPNRIVHFTRFYEVLRDFPIFIDRSDNPVLQSSRPVITRVAIFREIGTFRLLIDLSWVFYKKLRPRCKSSYYQILRLRLKSIGISDFAIIFLSSSSLKEGTARWEII